MPQPPIVLPIIITGLTLGSILASQAKTISKKRFAGISLISGLLNSAYAVCTIHVKSTANFLTRRHNLLRRRHNFLTRRRVSNSIRDGFHHFIIHNGLNICHSGLRNRTRIRADSEERKSMKKTKLRTKKLLATTT